MATKTTPQRKTAERTRAQARQTTVKAQQTAEQAERTVESALKDAGYATLGAGDAALALTRSVGRNVRRLPQRAMQAPAAVGTLTGRALRSVRDGYVELSTRGRVLTGQVRRNTRVQEATQQVSTARSQVKAAATSLAKAAEKNVEALGEAVDAVGTAPQDLDLEDLKVDQLRELAAELDVEGRSQMDKAELVEAIRARR